MIKALVVGVIAAALAFGLSVAPRAMAGDDRLNFTATTLSGAPSTGRACRASRLCCGSGRRGARSATPKLRV
ncbi:soluble secreted antigen MPT53 [Mycobacterium xenopi 4042]|uniref:Soluble secreted antigen MPT53 n=1 Tax=Mycobacterium xenopi 4042 TaxID=1299334 RepID=X8E8D8_MYCXE|nr:soluble secreted antigen MPT53 [Mycobacterium xenopi 3993]EUA76228.1 soluble secreted antigen MPT53 [Mycobacterium xenopi 4042]